MDPEGINFTAIPRTAINVVTGPAEFFRGMPKAGGFMAPLVFAVTMGLIAGIIQAVLGLIGLGHAGGYDGGIMGSFRVMIIMPIAAAVGTFIGAAIFFIIWKLMGSQENYQTAFRCGAYLMALSPITSAVGVVPYAGGIITMAVYIFYIVTASIHVHNIPSQKAWLVFGLIGVVFATIGLFSEYKIRHMASSMNQWRQKGEEYRKSVRDTGKSSEEIRKQAEKMVEQIKEQAQDVKKQAE